MSAPGILNVKTNASKVVFLAILVGAVLSACTNSSTNPPQMFQVCIDDENDVDSLIALVEQLALSNDMNVVDRSQKSNTELTTLRQHPGYSVISVSASRPDGLGIAVGNLGLGANEVTIGITQGAHAEDSGVLIKSLLGELQHRWEVRPVPVGKGAEPSSVCSSRK